MIFADPETFKPTLAFFEVIAPPDSQDAPGLKQSIIDVFINKAFARTPYRKDSIFVV